jgi:hypothetical protein
MHWDVVSCGATERESHGIVGVCVVVCKRKLLVVKMVQRRDVGRKRAENERAKEVFEEWNETRKRLAKSIAIRKRAKKKEKRKKRTKKGRLTGR